MAIYAVGDIQGCYDCLRRLLDRVKFDPATDRLWSVGDLVNRGPQSLDTLRFLKSLGDSFTPVLGNHDLHLLALAAGACKDGKKRSLLQILNAPDCHQLCEWIRQMPLLHCERVNTQRGTERFVMVHAGFAPAWKLKDAKRLAAEVETTLRGNNYKRYLKKMYGDLPDTWDESLTGMKRLRVITNYLTRMRFCNADGKLNMEIKTGARTAPKGYQPWYKLQAISQKNVIVFGHWATLNGVTNTHNVYALDTGCVWGRRLTVLRLEDRRKFSISCS